MPTVLITGCDTGLGVEFARQYAEDGFRVLATCLDPDSAAETRAIRGMIEILQLDVSDHAAIEALARKLDREPLDILLSNAGIGLPHPPFGQTDYGHWRRILEVNLIGPMRLAESFVEHVARSELKVMAFVSSRMGSIGLNLTGGSYAYRSSKVGLNAGEGPRGRSRAARDLLPGAASGLGQDGAWRPRRSRCEHCRHARRDPPRGAPPHRLFPDLRRPAAAVVKPEIAVAAPIRNRLGEAPMWNGPEQALYWIDALAPAIHRLEAPASSQPR